MRFTLSSCFAFLFCSSCQLLLLCPPVLPSCSAVPASYCISQSFGLTTNIIKLSPIINKSVLISAVASVSDTVPLQFLTSHFRRDKWTSNASLCIVTQNRSNAFVKRRTKGLKQKIRNVLLLCNIIWINIQSSANVNTKQAAVEILS